MRSSFFMSLVCTTLVLGACSSNSPDAEGDVASGDTSGALSTFAKSLAGSYSYLTIQGNYEELDTLHLLADGTYTATKPKALREAGKFTATTKTLTLKPTGAPTRVYALEAESDRSTLTITRAGHAELLAATTPGCTSNADCAKGETCTFAETGGTCTKAPPPPPPSKDAGAGSSACSSRRGGALITFVVADEPLVVWSTNGAFIDEAKRILKSGEHRTPTFDKVVDGADCDTHYSWHIDPAAMSFSDFTTEVCDGTPSYLENNKATWMKQVGRYCPWGPTVTAVDDRR
jgi:hypothetical protein